MEMLKGAAIFGQSGGPTSVINSSAAGVFTEALRQPCITKVYGASHGIKGILEEDFYDMGQESMEELYLLKNTPASALGSVRYKLADPNVDESDYIRLLEVFKKYDIRYFFYNGGNDSMDTCNKVSKYMQRVGYECRVIGVPKTIDNDLFGTDHCPGYGSAAKYLATSIMELYQDAHVYEKGIICVVEIMGRNAGWLTAASALASYKGSGPDLIYLPEVTFNKEQFIDDAVRVYYKNGGVLIAASEGIRYADRTYVADSGYRDSFGHTQLGGVSRTLAEMLRPFLNNVKVRAIEFNLLQRCASHCASAVDVEESFEAGRTAVQKAVEGYTDYCVGFERLTDENGAYRCGMKLIKLDEVANTEKKVPLEWINSKGNYVTDDFINYALPLVQGTVTPQLEDGLPRFAKLRKVQAGKK